jgi:hypothetical protein
LYEDVNLQRDQWIDEYEMMKKLNLKNLDSDVQEELSVFQLLSPFVFNYQPFFFSIFFCLVSQDYKTLLYYYTTSIMKVMGDIKNKLT